MEMKNKEPHKMRPCKWKPQVKSPCKSGVCVGGGGIFTAYFKTFLKNIV